jgi:hypothetical protein
MALRKKPLQIYLEERQHRALRVIARRRGVSVARLLRDGADKVIAETVPPADDPLMDLIELAQSGGPRDGAERHDAYLSSRKSAPRRQS